MSNSSEWLLSLRDRELEGLTVIMVNQTLQPGSQLESLFVHGGLGHAGNQNEEVNFWGQVRHCTNLFRKYLPSIY